MKYILNDINKINNKNNEIKCNYNIKKQVMNKY